MNIFKLPLFILLLSTINYSLYAQLKKDNAYAIPQPDSVKTLQDVIVNSKASIFERRTDRLVFNVNSTTASLSKSIWDILGMTPLVITSESGGVIDIAGKQGAKIYINDRELHLFGEALMNYLKSFPSDNVVRIEVITSPSSKYSAEGNAGIINIVTRTKTANEGLLGDINIQHRQRPDIQNGRSNTAAVNLNYRKSKWNIYSSANYWQNKGVFIQDFVSEIYSPHYFSDIHSNTWMNDKAVSGNLGVDYNLSSNHTIGILLQGRYAKGHQSLDALSLFYQTLSNPDSLTQTLSTKNYGPNNYNININYKWTIDTLGQALTIDANYFNSHDNFDGDNKTFLVNKSASPLEAKENYFNSSVSHTSNWSLQADYVYPVSKKITFSAGVKNLFTQPDNDLYFAVWNTAYNKDPDRSNHFIFKENILAGYGITDYTFNKRWSAQLGLRVENTITKGYQVTSNQTNNRNYWNLFPTFYLRYAKNNNHQFSYSFNRRINRPSYRDLNPFIYYITTNIYQSGNPYLQPSISFNNELNYTLKKKYIFQYSYSSTNDVFATLFTSADNSTTAIHYQTFNYGKTSSHNLSFVMNQSLLKLWNLQFNTNGGYVIYKGSYDNEDINSQSFYFNFKLNNDFTISEKKKWTAGIYCNYGAPQRKEIGKAYSISSVDLSLNKVVKSFSFSLNATNVFNTQRIPKTTNYFTNKVMTYRMCPSPYLSIAMKYKFGNKNMKVNKQRSAGNIEVINRV